MMRSIIYKLLTLIVTVLLFNSCVDNSVKPIFDKSINERAAELRSKYKKILSTPQHGWYGYYRPNRSAPTHAVLLKFLDGDSVVIHSNYKNRTLDDTITYRIDKTLKTELVLETHAIFHDIFEKNGNNYGGEFVFNITSAEDTKVVLTSKTDSGYGKSEVTKFTLKPAEADTWKLEWIPANENNLRHNSKTMGFRNLVIDDKPVANFEYTGKSKVIIRYMNDKNKPKILNSSVGITKAGFSFPQPLKIGKKKIEHFVYDSKNDIFIDAENNAKIVYSNLPGGPFKEYKFARRKYLSYNRFAPNNSSVGFRSFMDSFRASTLLGRIGNPVFVNLDSDDPQLRIIVNGQEAFWSFKYEIIKKNQNTIVKFKDIESANFYATRIDDGMKPLLDVVVGSKNGYYINGTGALKVGTNTYTNLTVSLIEVDNPTRSVNYFDSDR